MEKENWVAENYATDDHVKISQKLENYKGEFGVYKPVFKGRFDNEYPNQWYDWVLQMLVCLPIFVVVGLVMWGYLAWGFADSISYGWFCFGTFLGYIVILNILVFIFGRDRRKRERECIAAKFKENTEMRAKRREEAEINAKMLRDYQKNNLKTDFGDDKDIFKD